MMSAPEITAAPPEVKGWCPGAYAPMASNDGLLIRAKILGSRLTAAQAWAIAEIAANCGNGAVDLSQRAQLQIRGVREETLDDALTRLDAAGLLPPSAEAERVTNIVVSPLTGLAQGAFDANELAQALGAALQADEGLRALPAKFLYCIDDGGPFPLDDVAADIRIEATTTGDIVLRVAGAPARAIPVSREEIVPAALALAHAFTRLRAGREAELRRMERLVAAVGLDALLHEAGLSAVEHLRVERVRPSLFGARRFEGLTFCGVGMPFGRWLARDLAAVGEFADNEGFSEIRLTPWRAALIPAKSAESASRVALLARVHGFITSSDDLRLSVVACPGAPDCPQALGPTRKAIARVAALAHNLAGADGVGLHISGCAKGCARPGATPVTLVVAPEGYDIIDNGRAHDAAAIHVATMEEVVQQLAARASETRS